MWSSTTLCMLLLLLLNIAYYGNNSDVEQLVNYINIHFDNGVWLIFRTVATV